MIRNISYNNPDIKMEIEQRVGKPFSFMQKWKMRGNGSPRFLISEASPDIKKLLDRDSNANYCNIEIRPQGIVIGFRSILDTFGWIIPFNELKIFQKETEYHIYGGTNHVRIGNSYNPAVNSDFFSKVLNLKNMATGAGNPLG